ncbi:MAG: isoleucine--tRNA ligase [Deltaproteobacteria bacterium]|nr:isoleucine--tRNA ligase [Deltaproteobacteria bacterium]
MDYKDTLNLPSTTFPMKANLTRREPELLRRWEEMDLHGKILEKNNGKPVFTLHDGPPYANGNIHIGHALNKILKDIIIKYKSMKGYYAEYVPGWDCHGLPIELQVDKKLGSKKKAMTQVEFRRKCREYADRFVGIQREEFRRLGGIGAWDTPYLTMDYRYEGAIIREFGRFVEQGGVYKGKKPIHWCASCRTALAEAEVEYADEESPSVYVRFPLEETVGERIPALSGKKVFVVIWTTTPWTLPANLAVCLHPDFTYVAVETEKGVLIVAKERLKVCMESFGIEECPVLATFAGRDLEGLLARHPFEERDSLLIVGDHVTLEQGTGCVHTAPGHGEDDYKIGMRYDLDVYTPVDDRGCFTDEAGPFAGQFVFKANGPITELLAERGHLLASEKVEHSYPHCWRCKKPIIFRATAQWFISMEANDLRKRTLDTIRNKVDWIPAWGENRIYAMVENRPDWCISRQRSWGVPIAVFQCSACGEYLLDASVIYHVAGLVEKEGADIWFDREAKDLMPAGTVCPKCGEDDFEREQDILDVWFDSGVSHTAVIGAREGLSYPADLYLEGSDQHRGWFHSALLTALGTGKEEPFRAVLTHGFVVDGNGKKMSKSVGNVIAPKSVIQQNGAEILRLWVAAEDYRDDIKISSEILKRMVEAYRKIRNTARFILGNLSDFDPEVDAVSIENMPELDRWALHQLNRLIERVDNAYGRYAFHTIYHTLYNFCTVELSARYLDILKDRLYVLKADAPGRRASQTVLCRIITTLTRLMAPILSFTAEEIWGMIPGGSGEESVFLSDFPAADPAACDDELAARWEEIFTVRGEVSRALEEARRAKVVGLSLEAAVDLYLAEKWRDRLAPYEAQLPEIMIVSAVTLHSLTETAAEAQPEGEVAGVRVRVRPAEGEKCGRCWNFSSTVGEDPGHPDVCRRCAGVLRELGG